jgi:hypothetical protein
VLGIIYKWIIRRNIKKPYLNLKMKIEKIKKNKYKHIYGGILSFQRINKMCNTTTKSITQKFYNANAKESHRPPLFHHMCIILLMI